MKKLIALLAIVSTNAFAHGYGGWYGNGGSVLVPMIIGGAIGWTLSQNQRPPNVYNNTPRVYNINTAPPYPGATPVYQQRTQWEPSCNCYIVVYAQIGWQ